MQSSVLDADFGQEEVKEAIHAILAGRDRETAVDPSLTCAAVLIPLLFRDGEWWVLVTQRTEYVGHHKGQISFPGGARDPEDADLKATALREAYEEIGLPPQSVQIVGMLDDLPTITRFLVTPFVGVVSHPFPYRPNPGEVTAVVEVPLSFLRAPDNLRIEQRQYEGRLYEVLLWEYGTHVIWGATARMLKNLLDILT